LDIIQRVSCTCCGEDYSISSAEDFAQISGYHRGCQTLVHKTYRSGQNKGLVKPIPKSMQRYYEEREKPPKGWEFDTKRIFNNKYKTVLAYKRQKDVLVLSRHKIKSSERAGEVPNEGYVWVELVTEAEYSVPV